jgi:ABC-2 type transport system ATP-binding protein
MVGRRTVLLASHVLAEIEHLASRVMILRDGQMLTNDALREAGPTGQVRLRIGGPALAVLAVLRKVRGVTDAAPDTSEAVGSYLVETAGKVRPADLAQAIVTQGFALSELVAVRPNLERVFLS